MADYNPWSVGDIARFDIYLSDDGPFGTVTGRTPIASVGGETTEITLTGFYRLLGPFPGGRSGGCAGGL